jgi:hypothetical protein
MSVTWRQQGRATGGPPMPDSGSPAPRPDRGGQRCRRAGASSAGGPAGPGIGRRCPWCGANTGAGLVRSAPHRMFCKQRRVPGRWCCGSSCCLCCALAGLDPAVSLRHGRDRLLRGGWHTGQRLPVPPRRVRCSGVASQRPGQSGFEHCHKHGLTEFGRRSFAVSVGSLTTSTSSLAVSSCRS